jgi:hypothetical protein
MNMYLSEEAGFLDSNHFFAFTGIGLLKDLDNKDI